MAFGFAGLLAAVVTDRIGPSAGRLALGPCLVLSAGSVVYWSWSEQIGAGDLRPYLAVQFGSLALVVALLALYPARYTGTAWFVAGLGAYGVAKVLEIADAAIFAAAGVSGHTLKHLAAAGGIACVAIALRTRQTRTADAPPAPNRVQAVAKGDTAW